MYIFTGSSSAWGQPYSQGYSMPAMPSAGYSSYNPYMGGYQQPPGNYFAIIKTYDSLLLGLGLILALLSSYISRIWGRYIAVLTCLCMVECLYYVIQWPTSIVDVLKIHTSSY